MDRLYSTQEFDDALAAFRRQTQILERLTEAIVNHSDPVLRAAGPIAVAAEGSCKSVILLVEQDQIRDAFVTARTALLSIITACFILAEGPRAAERARRHASQKTIRDLHREVQTKDIRIVLSWSGTDQVDRLKAEFPELRVWLNEFERKSGKERIQWTEENVMEQIEAITRKYGQKIGSFLLMGIATIYRHASEIAHGTLFGELWFLGFTTPGDYPVTKSDLNSGPRKRATGMLGALSFCVLTLVKVLSDEFGNPENLFTEADEAIRDYISKIRSTGARGTERQ